MLTVHSFILVLLIFHYIESYFGGSQENNGMFALWDCAVLMCVSENNAVALLDL